MKLTLTELRQLRIYCNWVDELGNYYGNIDQFNYRHNNIVVFLDEAIEKLTKPKESLDKPSKV